jgi:hypothetical protein
MVMSPGGTFDYVAVVPHRSDDGSFECRARMREPVAPPEDRLVGLAPVVRVTDAGLTPNAGPQRPWVLRSRITLSASARAQAAVAEASFHVDKALTSSLKADDLLHMARTACGGLGLSVIRGGELVVAVGAVTAVPLGRGVEARIPLDMVAVAEAAFRQRDPEFEFPEWPVEITINSAVSVLYRGTRELGQYAVRVEHGFLPGEPGQEVCAAICRRDACADIAANASAVLVDDQAALSLRLW